MQQRASAFLASVFHSTIVRLAGTLVLSVGGFAVTAALGALEQIPWFYRYLAGIGVTGAKVWVAPQFFLAPIRWRGFFA
jgi:hypothetical protein